MSVKQCQREIDSNEFSEWMAYDEISPIGDERLDILAADVRYSIACSVCSNMQWADFLRDWWEEPLAEPTREECDLLWAKIDSFFRCYQQANAHGNAG